MFKLEQLRPDHEAAVLAFEQANRAYFVGYIGDRGDDYFAEFAQRFRALLAEQDAGVCAFFLLVDADGTVVGRFNLYDLEDGGADVGYRVAQRVSGRGVATSGLRELCRIAEEQYGLRRLRAAISDTNFASQRVVAKVGFLATGPAEVGGQQGAYYELALTNRTASFGVVKFWHAEKGWGAISSADLPEGRDAWAHFSMIDMPGYRTLRPGQEVEFRFRAQRQDSFDYVADWVRPAG